MPMLDSFLNHCNSLLNSYINWLANSEKQKEEGHKLVAGFNLFEITVENFLTYSKEICEYEQYAQYENEMPFKLLMKLYDEVDAYFFDFETVVNLASPEKVLADERWHAIQTLAQQVKKALEIFIKEHRE